MLTITPEGLVTAVAPGSATVTITTYNGKKKSGVLTVMEAPTSITLEPSQLTLGEGAVYTLTASVNPGSAGKIFFRSENPEIATVDEESGLVTARKRGRVRLIAYTYVSGLESFVDLEVKAAPTQIILPYEGLNIGVGDIIQLTPSVNEGAATTFSFSSSNKKYAAVNASGLVKAIKTGKIYITIKTHNGLSVKLPVNVKKAPSGVKASPEEIILGLGETVQIGALIPSDSATTLRYESQNEKIATVDNLGRVTAIAPGETNITLTTHNGKTAQCKVIVSLPPENILLTMPEVLGVGQKVQPQVQILPEGSYSSVNFSIDSGNSVKVDNDGNIIAVQTGDSVVRASTYLEAVYATQKVTVKPAPTSISFPQDTYTVNMGETLQLTPVLSEGSATSLTYTAKKPDFFTIDETGLITPIMRGSTTVTVTTHNGLSDTVTVWVVDPYYPEMVELAEEPPEYLEPGETFTPTLKVFPESAIAGLEWSSSNTSIASVDAISGKVTARSYGRVTITGKSTRNPALSISYRIIVLTPERCLVMPARRTEIGEISATQSQIKNVRASAYRELESLVAKGIISQSEANTRKGYIDRAFDMYLFPWMTETKELYWNANNSENGAKDFKPGIVYHGMAYTQTNRVNNKNSVLQNGYYTSSGKNYYLLNGDRFASRKYPGNDCSSFVSMAIWGMGSSRRSDNTTRIASASYYRTLSNWEDLRPGDIMNKSGSHVVMFLYYADASKSQIVIIEQGGGEAGTNTVSCSIRDVSYYRGKGYKIRRVSSLDH